MKRAYYSDTIEAFLTSSPDEIIGKLVAGSEFSVEPTQRDAWKGQIEILKPHLTDYSGSIYFEYSIPRMGRRIDVILLIDHVLFVIEFKVGEKEFRAHALDQVCDYALDLKNFHEPSHEQYIAPILIATKAPRPLIEIVTTPQNDRLLFPIKCDVDSLHDVIEQVLEFCDGVSIDRQQWEQGRYCPTPTIIEAALALYNGHSVKDISRNDAEGINLDRTIDVITHIIRSSREASNKAICFVTGVPGAGKTLVGLKIATKHIDRSHDLYSVFLSGNGPLVDILREALARDKIRREKEKGLKMKKGVAMSEVKAFIQNVHHFRDECLLDPKKPPLEHVALFDEAQRAWNVKQTTNFMNRRKNIPNFNISEPEFLISCLDRHPDWATIVCLVGGGQEINVGEAGISEWMDSLDRAYQDWHVYISPRLTDTEYGAGQIIDRIKTLPNVTFKDELHLAVSMRSFRAEHVSQLVKQILDIEIEEARKTLDIIRKKYPIVITRDLGEAKKWLKRQARGTERYGIVVSSNAERLRPHAIHVKSPINPIHWFLDDKDDIRSSYYLEDVATEFHVQGLELDWVCITWDADFRYCSNGWEHWSFRGKKWTRVRKEERQKYLKNAYRVLLTRARQGMVIVVPNGDEEDATRKKKYYDPTFTYLKRAGFEVI